MYRFSYALMVALMAFAVLVHCSPDDETGTIRVSFKLESHLGNPMTCDQAGVIDLYISVYETAGDSTPTHSVSVECDVDDRGEGWVEGEFPKGLYEDALVAMRDGQGQILQQYNGALAAWPFISVQVSAGGITDFLPQIVAVFPDAVQICGNSTIEPPEECDDGNTMSNDGCSAICTDEHNELIINWTPIEIINPVDCGDIDVAFVDISVMVAGDATVVADATGLDCTDLTYLFTDVPFDTYDIIVQGRDASHVVVAAGDDLGVNHLSYGGTIVNIDLVAQ